MRPRPPWYRHDFHPPLRPTHNSDTATAFQSSHQLEARPLGSLEPRLVRRRVMEAAHHRGPGAHRNGDFVLQHEQLLAWGIKTALQVSGLYARGRANALQPVVRQARLRFENLPTQLEGFRILHLSDFHIDGVDGLAEVVADRVASLPADLCVLTGDYRFDVRGPVDKIYPRMRRVLRAIRARHGIVGILGNHDCADIAIELESMGVRMLIDEAIPVGPFDSPLWLIGVDDPHFFGDDLAGALQDVPKRGFKLLMAHSPELFQEASDAGIHLYLSGHTHGGQIRLPGIGALAQLADCPRTYAIGHWRHGRMHGYTTTGVGCSLLPVRFNCPPEIVVIELARA